MEFGINIYRSPNFITISMYYFSQVELEILRAIFRGSTTADDIAKATNRKKSATYHTIAKLVKSGEISPIADRKGYDANKSGHISALRNFLLSGERPIESIAGPKMLALLSISSTPKKVERIAIETRIPMSSLRVYIWQLQSLGILVKRDSSVEISPSDHLINNFLIEYSKGACIAKMDEIAKSASMVWNEGLQMIFSSSSPQTINEARLTGTSAMPEWGIQFMSDSQYYYYAYWKPELKAEDVALHNILINAGSSRSLAYSVLLLRKSDFDKKNLYEKARLLGIEQKAKIIVALLEGKAVSDPNSPDQKEIIDLFAQYGVA